MITVSLPSGAMDHSAVFSSAHAMRFPFASKIHSVRAAGGLFERGEFPVDAPLEDAVVGLVGEKNISLRVAGRPFGELEITGELFHFGAWFNDGWHGSLLVCAVAEKMVPASATIKAAEAGVFISLISA